MGENITQIDRSMRLKQSSALTPENWPIAIAFPRELRLIPQANGTIVGR